MRSALVEVEVVKLSLESDHLKHSIPAVVLGEQTIGNMLIKEKTRTNTIFLGR